VTRGGIPALAGSGICIVPKRPVVLTPFAPDDLEIYREYGLKAMQNARLLRLVEEAYRQGAVFDQPHLCLPTSPPSPSVPAWFPFGPGGSVCL